MDDGEKMLVDLLGVRVRVPREPDMTLARILLKETKDDVALDHGLKIEEQYLHIHPSHPSLVENIDRLKSWSGVDVKKTFKNDPGGHHFAKQPLVVQRHAAYGPSRFQGSLARSWVSRFSPRTESGAYRLYKEDDDPQEDIPF